MQAAEGANKDVEQGVSGTNRHLVTKHCKSNMFGQLLLKRSKCILYDTVNVLDDAKTKQRCSICGETGHNRRNAVVCQKHPSRRAGYLHLYDEVKESDLNLELLKKYTGKSKWEEVLIVPLWVKYK